ncbi:DNA-deoxyinosine glycosylase [Paenibacillus sp. B01]|uniref:DNA-deoxyinosine glycosylase n=1 Tax=Paenibacillus sp. B01 TaxID=2660554 RepID=UPI00129ACB2F|nr:DNA-deoxyinosine glycosylase [Paenibacillus sp. B01]QGG54356.1 DNA-deoxyinosine glycosylase [Paenibacillus sp. B01]
MSEPTKVYSFPPLIEPGATVLVLGSMPGVKSLQAQRYYANDRNFLWRILYALSGREPDETYEERVRYAARIGVGMWDMIGSCVRPGSLDMNIRDAEPNDLPELVKAHPTLRALAFNGTKSHSIYVKHFKDHPALAGLDLLRMPSTSPVPTPAMRTLEDRLQVWEALKPYLRLPSGS